LFCFLFGGWLFLLFCLLFFFFFVLLGGGCLFFCWFFWLCGGVGVGFVFVFFFFFFCFLGVCFFFFFFGFFCSFLRPGYHKSVTGPLLVILQLPFLSTLSLLRCPVGIFLFKVLSLDLKIFTLRPLGSSSPLRLEGDFYLGNSSCGCSTLPKADPSDS